MLEAANTTESAVALRWFEPPRTQEHHRHEGRGAANASDGSSADQIEGIGRTCDSRRTDNGEHREGRHRASAVAIEPHADRHLHRKHCKEESAVGPAELRALSSRSRVGAGAITLLETRQNWLRQVTAISKRRSGNFDATAAVG
jgi:hypothetical protein